MRTGKRQFLRRLQIQIRSVGSGQCERLPEIMIKIIMHLVPSFFFPAAEHIHIIPRFRSSGDDTHHTRLIRPAFRFAEIEVAVCDRGKLPTRFRRSRETGEQLKRMIAFHHRITRYSIYANRIMTRKLRIIFRIIQPAIQGKTDTRIGSQHISFSVKFHRNAVGVHVVALTSILRNHQTAARIHTISLHQPRDVRCMEQRRDIFFYLSRLHLRIQRQWLIFKKRIDRHPHILLFRFFISGTGIQAFQQGSEIVFLFLLPVCLCILYHTDKEISVQIPRMRISETANHTVGKQILRGCRYRFRQYRHRLHQIISQVVIKLIHKIGIIINHHTAISRTFRPDTRFRVKTIFGKTRQAPLTNAGTVHHIVYVIFPSFPVGIRLVVFQHQPHIHDKPCLQQIPVIMRHSVRYDIVRPFLECSGVDFHLLRVVCFQIIIQEVV